MNKLKKSLFLMIITTIIIALSVSAQASEEIEYYGRNKLAEMDKAETLLYAYDSLVAGVAARQDEIAVWNGTDLTTEEMVNVIMTYEADYAHHFWRSGAYSYSGTKYSVLYLYPEYLFEADELVDVKADFEREAEIILAGIDEEWSEFEKELYLHDVLAGRIRYDESDNAHNAYGALVEGIAVCEGYAESFQYLLHRAGIQSYLALGYADDGYSIVGHEWNYVRIDGEYYHVDLTWDDMEENLFHAYFNINDRFVLEDHGIDDSPIELPVCESMDANYFAVKGGLIEDYDIETVTALFGDDGIVARMYLTDIAEPESFNNWYNENLLELAEAVGVRDRFYHGIFRMGREVDVLIMPLESEGMEVTVEAQHEGSVYMTLHGKSMNTCELYIAFYDSNGQMMGFEAVEDYQLDIFGNFRTVNYEEDTAMIKVFAMNSESYEPISVVAEIEIG